VNRRAWDFHSFPARSVNPPLSRCRAEERFRKYTAAIRMIVPRIATAAKRQIKRKARTEKTEPACSVEASSGISEALIPASICGHKSRWGFSPKSAERASKDCRSSNSFRQLYTSAGALPFSGDQQVSRVESTKSSIRLATFCNSWFERLPQNLRARLS